MNAAEPKCQTCELILDYATYVGNGLSIVGLLLTIAVYLGDLVRLVCDLIFCCHLIIQLETKPFKRQVNRKLRSSHIGATNKFMFDYYIELLIALSGSLLLMNAAYIAFSLIGGWQSGGSALIGCMICGVALHYLLLCSFAWMSALALLQHLIFNKVLVVVERYFLKACIVSFGNFIYIYLFWPL